MSRGVRFFILLGLGWALLLVLLSQCGTRDREYSPLSPLVPPSRSPAPSILSPLAPPTTTSLHSPLPVPPTAPPPVTTATLEAIRATRPTATPPSPSGIRLPYISPVTWRNWALRIMIAAGLLAYIGLRLRRGQ